MEEKQKGFWNTLKAKWYQKGLKFNTLPETALKIILPETKDCKTFLDVGAGCGTFGGKGGFIIGFPTNHSSGCGNALHR